MDQRVPLHGRRAGSRRRGRRPGSRSAGRSPAYLRRWSAAWRRLLAGRPHTGAGHLPLGSTGRPADPVRRRLAPAVCAYPPLPGVPVRAGGVTTRHVPGAYRDRPGGTERRYPRRCVGGRWHHHDGNAGRLDHERSGELVRLGRLQRDRAGADRRQRRQGGQRHQHQDDHRVPAGRAGKPSGVAPAGSPMARRWTGSRPVDRHLVSLLASLAHQPFGRKVIVLSVSTLAQRSQWVKGARRAGGGRTLCQLSDRRPRTH